MCVIGFKLITHILNYMVTVQNPLRGRCQREVLNLDAFWLWMENLPE